MDCEQRDAIEVTVGAQTYTPLRYASFTVGALTYRTNVRQGESVEQAHDRAVAALRGLQERSYSRMLGEYLTRLERASERALRTGNRAL